MRWHKIFGFHTYAFGWLRKLYDWVLSWGHTKYGTPALCALAFAESSFFPIPPDVLLMCLNISRPKRSFWYAILCTIFSVLGGLLGFFIGFALYETMGQPIIAALGYSSQFELVGNLFKENAVWAIFAAGFTPIPYKVFTIAAGVWGIALPVFITASLLGRGIRFFVISALLYFFGERVKVFIDKYFNWVSLAALALMFAGFVAIRYLH